MKYLTAYGIAVVIFLALDALWLGVIARNLYVTRMGDLMAAQPRWGVAILFYALFVIGLIYFAVTTGLESGNWQTAALNGALFGFFCYLTYDATNLSVIEGYDPLLAVIDTVWGTILGAITAGATTAIMVALGRNTG